MTVAGAAAGFRCCSITVKRNPLACRLSGDADPHSGVYPHRDANSPMTADAERGYGEFVAIIEQAGQSRRKAPSGVPGTPLR